MIDNKDKVKRIIQYISNELRNIHERYGDYTADDIKWICKEFAYDLDIALEEIERK